MMSEFEIREFEIKRVLKLTLALNLFVAFLKIIVGYSFHYLSLKTSGVESIFDGASNIMALISISLAIKPADDGHNFGHQKYETLGSFIIAGFLFFSAIQMAYDWSQVRNHLEVHAEFGLIPMLSIIISMCISLFVAKYESAKGRELGSSILQADAHHSFGDFLISFGVVISIALSYYGYIWPDLIFGGIVCLYLFYLAFKIIKVNLPDLLDASPEIEKSLIKSAEDFPKVYDIHKFRARGNHNWMQVDFHLHLDPTLSLIEAHNIGKKVEAKMKEILLQSSKSVEILIHIEPYEEI